MATGAESASRPRRRDAAATRQALLDAARLLLAEHGVEGASTRDVAATAGVNQALVYRYFGSKDKLFAEAAEATATDRLMLDTPLPDLPAALLARVLDLGGRPGDQATVSALVTAANDETIRAIIRERINTSFGEQLAGRLSGPDARLRAELVAAVAIGIGFLCHKIDTPALRKADPDALTAYVDRMIAPLLDAGDA